MIQHDDTFAPARRARLWTSADVVIGASGAIVLTALAACLYALKPMSGVADGSEHPLEGVTLGWWSLAVVASVAVALTQRGRDRMGGGILLIMAVFAILRELDMHSRLEPQSLGRWGVEMRIDWWLEATAPMWIKGTWAVLFGLPVVVIVVLAVRQRAPLGRLALAGDPSSVLLLVAGGLLLGGAACDDLLRDATFVSDAVRKSVEEWLELLGGAAFAGCAVWSLARPLHEREAALRGSASPAG